MNTHYEDIARPHGRDLTENELQAVACQVAARQELWSEHVSHDPDQRTYAELVRDEHLDVWLLCWSRDHDTGFHDHDLSAGAVAVAAGAVREERLVLGRGVDYLLRTQQADGLWSHPSFTAPGFPRIFYLKYHGYCAYFPLWALARYRRLQRAQEGTA